MFDSAGHPLPQPVAFPGAFMVEHFGIFGLPASPVSGLRVTLLLFSHSVMSSSLRPHGLQHARPPCPPLSPGVCSNSCPLSQWCHPTVSSSVRLLLLPSIFLGIGVFSNQSGVCIRWSKYWSFSFCIIPANENSGLISFRMDWLDLLAVQGTLKSLLQYNSQASIIRHLAFFTVQLSHPYMTTGKTTALTIWTFVSKVMSLLFSTLSRFATAFLPRSKHHEAQRNPSTHTDTSFQSLQVPGSCVLSTLHCF